MNGDTAHRERHFEGYILQKLKAGGWEVGDTEGYDAEHALYPEDVVVWLEATQTEKWAKLRRDNAENPQAAVMERLAKVLEKDGTMQVLRRGLQIAGCGQIDLSEAAPEDMRNMDVVKRYKSNILRVVPQLKYHPSRELAIDLVFFINGIPVATVEVKTDFTQSAEAAVQQYKDDRRPFDPKTRRKEPLLTFKRGAIVHFALSESDIQMATKLDGENTVFLPFNQGNAGSKGNPPRTDGEYPVAYFWEQICQRDAWLRIFHSFVYVQKKDVVDLKGDWSIKETLIFPRFHQWAAVNTMIADAKKNGPGMPYLCEHSAGSGKTSTISWIAHDLIKLRSDDGDAIFSSVIIVTDRTVLDDQLQDAVKQIDHQFGVIAAIDRQKGSESKSKQLSHALLNQTPIIVVTIQTFPHALEVIATDKSLDGKNFAVIIDEAHNSQTGTNATKLQTALALTGKGGMAGLTIEEILAELQKSRARPKNVSYFAFTATPKHSTYMLFGRPAKGGKSSKDSLPEAFHKYPMRQAIEEGFILDVLQGYTPYRTAYNLSRHIEDTSRVGNKAAKSALGKWMTLHPTNVIQKVEFIVEHFSRNVAHRLDGKAKAMVVTSSRAAVIRYKLAMDKFISDHPEHAHVRALVAFSGKLTGKEVMHADDPRIAGDPFNVDDEAEFSESSMNPAAVSSDLRVEFDRPEYRIMLVADKFQTGFDQPKLVAMYVDKLIGNDVEIVQTFSRLNRTAPGKKETFIIDFANEPDNVKRAFAIYDDGAVIDNVQDPNVVYDIKGNLDKSELYSDQDLEVFKAARFRSVRDATSAKDPQHKELYAATEAPSRRYNDKLKRLQVAIGAELAAYDKAHALKDAAGMASTEHRRTQLAEQRKTLVEFKSGLGRFCKTYAYVAQIVDFGDPELENFAAFAKLLIARLDGVARENVDMHGLVLTGYEIKARQGQGNEPESVVLRPIGPGGAGKVAERASFLQEIIERINALFGEVTPLTDQAAFVNHIAAIAGENEDVKAQVANNSRDHAMKGHLPSTVETGVVRALGSNETLASHVLSDKQAMQSLVGIVYDLIRKNELIRLEELR